VLARNSWNWLPADAITIGFVDRSRLAEFLPYGNSGCKLLTRMTALAGFAAVRSISISSGPFYTWISTGSRFWIGMVAVG
jgi:hypothetical protein